MYAKKKYIYLKLLIIYIHMKTTEVIILFLVLKKKFFNKVYIIEQSRETKLNLSFYIPPSLRMIRF